MGTDHFFYCLYTSEVLYAVVHACTVHVRLCSVHGTQREG